MSVSLVKGCRRCCAGPFAPKLPIGYPPNLWDETGSFRWSLSDLEAEVSARFGPEWRLDAARDLRASDYSQAPSWRAYFAWDSLVLIVHARASWGDAWERRDECREDCHDDGGMPHMCETFHYIGPSWILSADMFGWDEANSPVADAAAVARILA